LFLIDAYPLLAQDDRFGGYFRLEFLASCLLGGDETDTSLGLRIARAVPCDEEIGIPERYLSPVLNSWPKSHLRGFYSIVTGARLDAGSGFFVTVWIYLPVTQWLSARNLAGHSCWWSSPSLDRRQQWMHSL
jgi:hypothetical protein